MDRNKVQSILQEAVENPDLARQNLIRLQNAWGEVIESLGGPDKALLVGSQPVAANEHHAILAFESSFNAGQTMKRDNLNTMFGNILSQAAGFSPEILAISMEEWKEVRAAFSAKAKSSQDVYKRQEYDRAAPNGTGAAKVGGNYAASLLPGKLAKSRHFSDVIYLDPSTHTKIEEVGSANFFGITADNEFVTPLSPSILPSITKYSLLYLAEHRLGLTPIEGDVPIDNLDRFVEAGACGTAAVISPIGGIQHGDDFHVFYSETEVGPVTRKLYDELTGIQFGDIEAPEGWIVKVD